MKRAIFGVVATGALAFACVDLFHSTDFKTLCDDQPDAAGCPSISGEGGADAYVPPGHYETCGLPHDTTQQLAHRACAWLGSCLGPLGESQYGPCVIKAELAYDCEANPALRPRGQVDGFWSCLANEGKGPQSCAQVYQCAFPKTLDQPKCGTVDGGAFFACDDDDDVRVQCQAPGNGPPVAAEPCALSGRHCVKTPTSAFCVAGKTTADPPGAPACRNTSASIAGNDGVAVDKGIDCANYGARSCVAGTGRVTCTTDDAGSCGSIMTAEVVCNGTRAISCDGAHALPVDCARLGPDLGCVGDASAPLIETACGPTIDDAGDAGTICPAGKNDECVDLSQGSTLQSCALGRVQAVHCADVGLGGCVTRDRGAACTKPPK